MVTVFDESKFVTCTVCEDYDLCVPCHVAMKHGHHPGHGFAPVSPEVALNKNAVEIMAPGRHTRHWAVCDGCDKVSHRLGQWIVYALTGLGYLWHSSQMPQLP